MTWRERLTEWLDIRPAELRVVVLSFLGAFLVMGFVVLAGSLRDAFYLGFFDAATLPYVMRLDHLAMTDNSRPPAAHAGAPAQPRKGLDELKFKIQGASPPIIWRVTLRLILDGNL